MLQIDEDRVLGTGGIADGRDNVFQNRVVPVDVPVFRVARAATQCVWAGGENVGERSGLPFTELACRIELAICLPSGQVDLGGIGILQSVLTPNLIWLRGMAPSLPCQGNVKFCSLSAISRATLCLLYTSPSPRDS